MVDDLIEAFELSDVNYKNSGQGKQLIAAKLFNAFF